MKDDNVVRDNFAVGFCDWRMTIKTREFPIIPQTFLENLYHYKDGVLVQLMFFTASKNLFRILSYKHLNFWWKHVIVWLKLFDLPKVDNAYCRDYV